MKKLSQETVDHMQRFRRAGAPVEDLSRVFRVSRVTVWRYTQGIEHAPGGYAVDVVGKAALSKWLERWPGEGVPVPGWVTRSMEESAMKANPSLPTWGQGKRQSSFVEGQKEESLSFGP